MNALFYCYGLLLGVLIGFFISEYFNYKEEQKKKNSKK